MSILKRIGGFLLRNKWRLLIAAAILIPLGAIVSFALSPTQPEYLTEAAERGDLEQTVEAVGTVISERDLALQFPTSGIVAQVLVKEGDTVQAGQRLATLRAGNLAADVSAAAARLQQAEADLRAMKEGSRPEDIAVTEADVASKRAALETARTSLQTATDSYEKSQSKLELLLQQANINLAGDVTSAASAVLRELVVAQNALSEVKDVLSNNDVIDAIIKTESSDYSDITIQLNSATTAVSSALSKPSAATYDDALVSLESSRNLLNQTSTVVNRMLTILNDLPVIGTFTEEARQTYKGQLTPQRTAVQTSFNNLSTQTTSLRNASASYQTQIAAEESAVISAKGSMDKATSDIATYEASLRIAEAQLQLKKAPARQTDIDARVAAVNQARASLARASADYGNTILTAPIAGRITKVNVKTGEFTPAGAAVTMLGNSPYRIEMFVSEVDVPKVKTTQSGSIELDAFRGTNFQLRVSEIDPAATDRDGVPKYRVKLDYVYPHDELKIGMTGDAVIVTGVKKDVISVPLRAVLERDDGTQYVRVIGEDGTIEEKTVSTGLEGESGSVEVTGIEEGENVIVLEKS